MIANAAAYIGPIHEILQLLSTEEVVPESIRHVISPVTDGLAVVEQLSDPLAELMSSSWDSLAGVGAAESVGELTRTVEALTQSAGEIGRVTAQAAEIVVRGTVEVVGIVQEFVTRAAGLGPTLLTPGGQIAILGLAYEHLMRGIHVAERVQSELAGPTQELQAIAAAIPAAPQSPAIGGGDAVVASPTGLTTGDQDTTTERSTDSEQSSDEPDDAADSADTGGPIAPTQVQLPDGSVATAPNPQAASAVEAALTQQGTPYSWGGTTPDVGMDCSGFTQWAYGEAGIDIPRLAQEQSVGTAVSQSELMPGDLAVWDGHVAMYIGNNQLVEAGDPISVSGLRTDNIGMQFHGFYRPTSS